LSGKRERAIELMERSVEILKKRQDCQDHARAELLASWWRAKNAQEDERSTDQKLPEILENIGLAIEVIPNVQQVEDPDLPDHEIGNSEIADRVNEWLKSLLPDTIRRENYTGMADVYGHLAGIERLSGSEDANIKQLEANWCLCKLILSKGSEDTSCDFMELRSKLASLENLEWPYSSAKQVSSERLLQEVSCLELEFRFAESSDLEVLGELVESTRKLEETESFVLLDRVLRGAAIETQSVHLGRPSERRAFLEGVLELKRGQAIAKEAPSEAEKHYIAAEKLLQECNDPNLERVHELRLEIAQKAECVVCKKEKTGLRVNYDIVKIESSRPESVLFKDVASVLGALPEKEMSVFPVCRDCQGIIETTLRQKSKEVEGTAIDAIRKQTEESRKAIDDSRIQAVTAIDENISKIQQQGEALSQRCREEEQRLVSVGQQCVADIQTNGTDILERFVKEYEDLTKILEDFNRQHDARLSQLESKMTTVSAALGVGGVVGFFSGQSLKDRVESLDQEVSMLKQHAGLS